MTEALTVDVVDSTGKKTGSVELPAEVFDTPINILISGNISDAVYKADDKMDDIKLDKVKAIYSYQNGDSYMFSNPET